MSPGLSPVEGPARHHYSGGFWYRPACQGTTVEFDE